MSDYLMYISSSSLISLLDAQEQAEYKYKPEQLGGGGFFHRITYLNTTLYALTDLVMSVVNLVFSFFDSLLFLFQSTHHNYLCKRCWIHIDLACMATMIGVIGTIIPAVGAKLSRILFQRIVAEFPKESFFTFILNKIKNFWDKTPQKYLLMRLKANSL